MRTIVIVAVFLFLVVLLYPSQNQLVASTAENDMGNAVRMMKYDRNHNVANAIPSLDFLGQSLEWYRLDDGVMGGRSETVHGSTEHDGLHFTGTINTAGGGFASIRASLASSSGLPREMEAIRLRFRGDGKTYKVLLSDGKPTTGSPFARTPSWQADLPTDAHRSDLQETIIPLSTFRPTWGGRASSHPSEEEQARHKFDHTEMMQIGLMLSLYLSDGRPNPKETFGEGVFPFSLHIKSIEPVMKAK